MKSYERTIYRQTQPADHSTGDRLRNYSTFRERQRLGRPQWNREHLCGSNKDFAPGKSDNATIFNCMMQLKITLGTAGRRLSLQKGQDYECCIQQGPANLLWAERGKNSAKVLSRVRNELFKRIIFIDHDHGLPHIALILMAYSQQRRRDPALLPPPLAESRLACRLPRLGGHPPTPVRSLRRLL